MVGATQLDFGALACTVCTIRTQNVGPYQVMQLVTREYFLELEDVCVAPRPCQNPALHRNPTGLCNGCRFSPKNINRTRFVATSCVFHCVRTGVKTGRDMIDWQQRDADCGKKKLSRFQLQGRFRLLAVVRTQRLHCSARFVVNPS